MRRGLMRKAEGRSQKAESLHPSSFILHPSVLATNHQPLATRASGFTLIEMLIALVITLIMMGAVVTLFGVVSESVSASRSAIELSNRLRAARNQLQLDLRGATATMKPPLRPENDEGYFEYLEGQLDDKSALLAGGIALFGDIDDVLMFTTRSRGAPFVGRFLNGTVQTVIESPVAEVAYFLVQDGPVIDATTSPAARLCTLYRRVLLVVPSLGPFPNPPAHFYDGNDISVRFDDSTTTFFANTLGDLTKRENRFAHYGNDAAVIPYGTFPFPVDARGIPVPPASWPPGDVAGAQSFLPTWPAARVVVENAFLAPLGHERRGDDVLLPNVLAFDVQVWDTRAEVRESGGVALAPSDPGWSAAPASSIFGAYVDLGYRGGAFSLIPDFGNPPTTKSQLSTPPLSYDTWSLHYENNGINEDQSVPGGDLVSDAATNGLDDGSPGNGVVDDKLEADTLPPYEIPLRGIRITLRVYEPDSQQVREVVVVQDFLPE